MKKSKMFRASCVFSALNIVTLIGYIIYSLLSSHILNIYFILTPLIGFLLTFLFIVIKKIPDILKLVLSVLITFSFLALFCLFNLTGPVAEFRVFEGADELKTYNQMASESNVWFGEELESQNYGDFEEITAYKYHSRGIWQQFAYTTISKYDDNNFAKEKEKINQEFDFFETQVLEDDPVPIFTKDGFEFKITSDSGYPKCMHLIGINNTTNEIAHIYFQDDDLDGVLSFENFPDTYCGWKSIVKDRK